jgi:hypothetical protein
VKLRELIVVSAVVAAFAALWPAAGSAAGSRGVVVAKQRGTMLVATPNGLVRAIGGHASVGTRIAFRGGRVTGIGRATTVRIHGIVVRRVGSTLFVSSNRHLLALRAGRVVSAVAPTTPGTLVDAQIAIRNGELEIEDEDEVGRLAASTVTVQATVAAVAPGSVTLTVQAQSLTVPLPAGLTLPATLVGQTVTARSRRWRRLANRTTCSIRAAASTTGRPLRGPRSSTRATTAP